MALWDSAAIATLVTLDDIRDTPVGGDPPAQTPVLNLVAEARSKGYEIVCLPLTTQEWKVRWTETCLLPTEFGNDRDVEAEKRAEEWRSKPAFLRNEVTMTRLDEAEHVAVLISDWLELDAEDDWVRHDYEIALQQELAYASYLNVQTAILPPPRNRRQVASYARAVNACLKHTPYIQLSIRLPIYDPPTFDPEISAPPPARQSVRSSAFNARSSVYSTPRLLFPDESLQNQKIFSKAVQGELNATWEMWDVIRTICDYDPRLTLALDLTLPLPSTLEALNKWSAEYVRYVFLPAATFIPNARGYPVLPKGTQSFIRDSMTHQPTIILSEASSGIHARGDEAAYTQYLRHLESTSPAVQAAQKHGTVENFAQGYQDYLQAPLQPLMDNLQSVTYQTFEQDPVKYRHYEEAIFRAITDWPDSDRIVICVAGAGRGPLVARCLTAIERSCRTAFIYAVEKNPNAFVTLQGRKQLEWGPKVELLFGDMRFIDVPELADIIISELLGSFGDNELSPECLDGAMRFLKPNGISIPSSYTAHLAPLSSSKLYNEARFGKETKSLETPYVVMFQAVNILSGEAAPNGRRCGPQVQECWEFEHPRRDAVVDARGLPLTNSHNARAAKLRFHIPQAGVLHGFAGYFEAVLYGNVGLSIHPHRKSQISKDMLSWFPLFFPIKEPLYLPSDSELQVSIWRLTNQRQVWYEWYAESFLPVGKPVIPPSINKSFPPSHLISGVFGSPSPVVPPSPLIDAMDSPSTLDSPRTDSLDDMAKVDGVVKIGQTSLHNPGGRSSWIGL